MRFLFLVAHAFGPFRDRRVEFAPRLNVFYGPNEAGKSSLHAALYAGLCGMRRGKGRAREEQEFEERHRPWQGGGWKVSLAVQLEDGRRVEILQDLDGKMGGKALDMDVGRDCTSELLHEGALDGSRWLGLDRRAFLATACVRQAQLLAVLDDPKALQEHLQRAVASSGADSTAAAALSGIDTFQKERVGSNRSNSTKPLRRAHQLLEQARERLDQARADHDAYLQLLAREDALLLERDQVERRLWIVSAALAVQEKQRLETRLGRARTLAGRYPEGRPLGLVAGEELAQEVTRAVQAWESRPESAQLSGAAADELVRELEQLQSPSEEIADPDAGDLSPAREVQDAATRCRSAGLAVEEHLQRRPPAPRAAGTGGAGSPELWRLADILRQPEPRTDPHLEAQAGALQQRIERLSGRRRRLLGSAGLAGAAGLVLAALGAALGHGLLIPGLVLILVAAALAAPALVPSAEKETAAAREQLQALDARRTEAMLRQADWAREIEMARHRLADLGLPADPQHLVQLAEDVERAALEQQQLAVWEQTSRSLGQRLADEEPLLRDLLRARGVPAAADIEDDLRAYEQACERRSRRTELQKMLAARRVEEERAARIAAQRRDAERAALQAAAHCGIEAEDVTACVAALQEWSRRRRQALQEQEQALQEWHELENLLDGRSLDVLTLELKAKQAHADYLAERFDPEEIERAAREPSCTETERETRKEDVRAVQGKLENLRTEMALGAQRMIPVADAEEELGAAERELARVQRLDATLQVTREFLSRAQAHVHRDIAPVLGESVQRWLSDVTAGRYAEVLVDPETLAVQVRAPQDSWRPAALLSHGTAEQIYLLLRVAMARHLTRRGEVCPLVLDDVTVQSDRDRKLAILETLRALSEERQIVLLTQEDEVLAWAEEHLAEPGHRIERLEIEAPPGRGARP